MSEALKNALGQGKYGDVDKQDIYVETRDFVLGFAQVGEVKRFGGQVSDGWIPCDGHIMTDEEKLIYPELADKLSNYEKLNPLNPYNDGSLIARYPLNEDATDLLDNYNATDTDVIYEDGKFDNCSHFDGNSGYVEFPDDLFETNKEFDCTFWYKAPDTSASVRSVTLRKNISIEFFTDNGKFHCNGDGTETAVSNTWYYVHMSATSNATKTKIYTEDGDLLDTINGDEGISSDGGFAHNWLGRNDTIYYETYVDNFMVFNRELTDDEANSIRIQCKPCN